MTTSAQARIAVYTSWANTADRTARTAPGRAGMLARFTREARERLGPDASDEQVAAAAEAGRKAYYQRFSQIGLAARQRRRAVP